MANTFKIKRRTSGSSGAPASLYNGELAFNEVDNKLYYGAAGGVIKEIGGDGAFITLNTQQTISQAKTFVASVDLGSSAVATTKSRTDNTTSVASTAFVQDVASLLDGGSF